MGTMYVSMFESKENPIAIGQAEGGWKDFVKLFKEPLPSTVPKGALGLWSPARYEGGHKKNEFVQEVYALTYDVDEDPIPSGPQLQQILAGMQTVVSTSSSATRLAPRWRVVFSLSRPVTPAEYQHLWEIVESKLPFPVGGQSKNVSRGWFHPRLGPDEYYEVFETEGQTLDVDYWLELEESPKLLTPIPSRQPSLTSEPGPDPRHSRIATAALVLGTNWPLKGRHTAQRALAGALCRDSWTQEAALDFLCTVCRHAGDEDRPKRAQTIKDTWLRHKSGQPTEGWSTVAAHVSSSIVSTVRDLLKRDDFSKLQKELGLGIDRGPVVEPATVDRLPTSLDFEYGAWEHEPPPVEFLVEGLVPRGCVAMWYGRADSLKTWLLYSLAIAMARGEPWLGRPTKKVKVGIIDYETGKGNVRRRLFMLRAGRTENLGTVTFPSLKPSKPEFWGELAKEGFDIVFIDSLRRSNPGADENDSEEAIIPLENAAEFSESTGCAVVYIHHAKKATSDGWPEFRGSAAIEDQVDCAFAVKKNDVGTTKKTVDVKCVKPGDMRTPDPFTAEVEFNDVARTAVIRLGSAAPVLKESEITDERIRQQIRLALADGSKIKSDVKKVVKGGNARVLAEIDAMADRGQLYRNGKFYGLDSPELRLERVLNQVEESDMWSTPAALAKASFVGTGFVDELLRDGVICRRAAGEPGFVKVDRSDE